MKKELFSEEKNMKKASMREFYLFPDILITLVIFVCALGYTFISFTSYWTVLSVFIGMIVFVVSEYLTHRFVFHQKPPKNPLLLKLMKRLHYDHHTYPNDLHLLFLPLWYSIPNFLAVTFIYFVFIGSLKLAIAFFTGVLGYHLFYEWKHFRAHRPIQPKTKIGKTMKKIHLWHHYKNENYWYGVTTAVIDKTLGTYKDVKLVEKSETAKQLEKKQKMI
jgi:sterol desaturase/sphingolipid hydroxylase (fatty acid hydroxylase superfamily)